MLYRRSWKSSTALCLILTNLAVRYWVWCIANDAYKAVLRNNWQNGFCRNIAVCWHMQMKTPIWQCGQVSTWRRRCRRSAAFRTVSQFHGVVNLTSRSNLDPHSLRVAPPAASAKDLLHALLPRGCSIISIDAASDGSSDATDWHTLFTGASCLPSSTASPSLSPQGWDPSVHCCFDNPALRNHRRHVVAATVQSTNVLESRCIAVYVETAAVIMSRTTCGCSEINAVIDPNGLNWF